MIRAAIALALALWAGSAGADVAKPSDLADTLRLLDTAMEQAGRPEAEIDWSDNSLILNPDAASDQQMIVYPDNLFRTLTQAPTDADRQQALDHFVGVILSSATQADAPAAPVDRAMILPILRNRDYLSALPDVSKIMWKPYIGDMILLYVVDAPDQTTSLHPDDAQALGLDSDGVATLANLNLTDKAATLQVMSGDFSFLQLDGYYESSFLLDAGIWDSIEQQIGPFLMVVPNRDLVIFSPDTPDMRAKLIGLRDKMFAEGTSPVSALLYRWTDTGWAVEPG